MWSRCLYDATTVADRVRDVVERTPPARCVTRRRRRHRQPRATRRSPTSSACPRPPIRWRRPRPGRRAGRRLAEADQAPGRRGRARAGRPGRARRADVRAVRGGDQRAARTGDRPPSRAWTGRARTGSWCTCTTPDPARPTPSPASSRRSTARPAPGSASGSAHQLTRIDIALHPRRRRLHRAAAHRPTTRPATDAVDGLQLRAGTPHGARPGPRTGRARASTGTAVAVRGRRARRPPARSMDLLLDRDVPCPEQQCATLPAADPDRLHQGS